MTKETITYTDLNGVQRTEDFYFDLSKPEIVKMLNMEAVLTDAAGKELARLTKVFSADGKDITSTVVYGK